MLKNAYLDAKIGFDPAENEPPKECSSSQLEGTAQVSTKALRDVHMKLGKRLEHLELVRAFTTENFSKICELGEFLILAKFC